MEKKPRVLSLYAPFDFSEESEIEMKVKIYPYSSQAHFLVECLKSYQRHTESCRRKNWKEYYRPIFGEAKLKDGVITTNVNREDLISLFFGYAPSEKVTTKLRELAVEDERTEQILQGLTKADEEVCFVYRDFLEVYSSPKLSLVVKVEEAERLFSIFKKKHQVKRPEKKIRVEIPGFPGQRYEHALYFVNSKTAYGLSMKEKLKKSQKPFIVTWNENYSFGPLRDYGELRSPNLSLIDCFPHKDERHRDFFENTPEYATPKNFLIKDFRRTHSN